MANNKVPLIDFRIRPPYKSFIDNFYLADASTILNQPGMPAIVKMCFRTPLPSRDEKSFELFLNEMDNAEIAHCVLSGRVGVDNREVEELVGLYPERFSCFAAVDLNDTTAALKTIKQLKQRGFSGVAFDNIMSQPALTCDDESLFPLYDYCQEAGLIVSINGSFLLSPDLSYIDPTHIERIARKFPGLSIISAHACYPWVTQACAVALKCPNVYLMPDLYPSMPQQDGYFDVVRAGLEGQLLFSSSFPAMSLDAAADVFRGIDFSPAVDAQLSAFNTAARLLGKVPEILAQRLG